MNLTRTPLSKSFILLLLLSNITLIVLVVILLFRSGGSPSGTTSSGEGEQLTAHAFTEPVTKLNDNIDNLSATMQRFNTSLVQYDFLQKEMERLTALEKALRLRAQVIGSRRTAENEEETKKNLAQASRLLRQVQSEYLRHRGNLMRLIAGLERELASTIDDAEIRKVLGSPNPEPEAQSPPSIPETPEASGNSAPDSSPDE